MLLTHTLYQNDNKVDGILSFYFTLALHWAWLSYERYEVLTGFITHFHVEYYFMRKHITLGQTNGFCPTGVLFGYALRYL